VQAGIEAPARSKSVARSNESQAHQIILPRD
jgi:hypothetical protein